MTTKITKACIKPVTGKLMNSCLNLRTSITYITSHLEEGGSGIRAAPQQYNQSPQSPTISLAFPYLPKMALDTMPKTYRARRRGSRWHLRVPRILLTDVSSLLCPELGHLDTHKYKGGLESKYLTEGNRIITISF